MKEQRESIISKPETALKKQAKADIGELLMFDYKVHFDIYCKDERLDLKLSFDMPTGYGSAYGTFDPVTRTVFINSKLLCEAPDHEKAFFLFHELRHASQYLRPERFGEEIVKSLPYTIMYDGTCCKLVDGEYFECKLDGGEEVFTDLYLGQPYEVDANTFAYEQVKKVCGDSDELRELYEFWMPRHPVPAERYDAVFSMIDEKIKS